jgi:Tfp pilus assembly protein PilF
MIRSLRLCLLCLPLVLGACVTTSNPQFGDKMDIKRASQDNVSLGIEYLKKGDRNETTPTPIPPKRSSITRMVRPARPRPPIRRP